MRRMSSQQNHSTTDSSTSGVDLRLTLHHFCFSFIPGHTCSVPYRYAHVN
jgi:hypothetical protein